MPFALDPNHSYLMPAHLGALQFPSGTSGWYHDVTAMTLSYVTDADRLAGLLPAPFDVGEEPLVSVVYARNRQVDWLAGHGYNLVAVNASAVYRGSAEELEGTFTLVMWENLTDPILSGRELQGIPKLYARIPDHSVVQGVWRATAGHFGHPIVDLTARGLREATDAEIADTLAAREGRDHPMAWRYLPGIGGAGTAVSEPTSVPSEHRFDEILVGEGTVEWHHLTWEQNPTQFHYVNALADLPILEQRPAVVTRGATNLAVLDRLPRRLG
ncbi:MAG TPA: acetoacetate decarboxylase family protein [Actinomycetes bacterium]|jgi:acetoacetate decarboxylase|nr:acetoacetate decarboxylase family protein [Actinomycetes bacterium]